MRFTDIYVNFDVTYEGHQNWSKILSMDILRVFGEHHMCHSLMRNVLHFDTILSVYDYRRRRRSGGSTDRDLRRAGTSTGSLRSWSLSRLITCSRRPTRN